MRPDSVGAHSRKVHFVSFAEEMMMRQDDQGWSFSDKSVCSECVADDALEQAIRRAEEDDRACDFCSSNPAAPLDVLLEVFVNGLRNEYENAVNGVGRESTEGGYQWSPKWNTWDLVGQFDTVLVGEGLVDAVRDAIHDTTWGEYDFVSRRRDVVLADSWARFCDAVKFETRNAFWLRPDDESDGDAGEVPAVRILDEVGALVDRLDLVRELPAGRQFWRAQVHSDGGIDPSGRRLGTAPHDRALRANRMSLAGIPMFYGADDVDTAIREVAFKADDSHVTWGQFEISAPAVVLNFTSLPAVPSMFDPDLGSMRRSLVFLHKFVAQLSDRVRPAHEPIDYVPTQIVTEYLLRAHHGGTLVQGLLYPSSLTGAVCAVLDIPNARCVDKDGGAAAAELQLRLAVGSVQSRMITVPERDG
jgi:hypothetical protein